MKDLFAFNSRFMVNQLGLLVSILLGVLPVNQVFGQLATVTDEDGNSNVRSAPSMEGEIIHQVQEGQVFEFEVLMDQPEWVRVRIPKNPFALHCGHNQYLVGYIHKSRWTPIDKLQQAPEGEVQIFYTIEPFQEGNHILSRGANPNIITAIDGRYAWGADMSRPDQEITKMWITISGNQYGIHPVFFGDLYGLKPGNYTTYVWRDRYFITNWNSDGGAAYLLCWVISKEGEFLQRLIFQP